MRIPCPAAFTIVAVLLAGCVDCGSDPNATQVGPPRIEVSEPAHDDDGSDEVEGTGMRGEDSPPAMR